LETASDITATPGITLDATQMAPTNNWAQFYWPTFDNGGYEEAVGFGFLWQNASAQHVVVNVTGFPILIGDLQAIAYGYYNPFELSFCNMRVDVRLNIQELWNQPPTSPPLQPGQEWGVVTNRASAGFFDDPEIVDKRVERGLVLGYDQLVVPPQGTVRIEVSCVMDTAHRNGEARFIFTNFDRQVQAYAVVINVLP
jgi:hypothetical protein